MLGVFARVAEICPFYVPLACTEGAITTTQSNALGASISMGVLSGSDNQLCPMPLGCQQTQKPFIDGALLVCCWTIVILLLFMLLARKISWALFIMLMQPFVQKWSLHRSLMCDILQVGGL